MRPSTYPQDGKPRYKKYPNRRLYDRATSKYITFHDLAESIRSGEVVVIEAPSGGDITREVLLDVLRAVEMERKEPQLSVEKLHALLRTA